MSQIDRWMPLYVGDYLADTMHLKMCEHAAYLLLIMHYWRHGPLPDDDGVLATISKADRKTWAAISPIIRAFFNCRGGRLHHKRIDLERASASENTDKKRDAANARWAKERMQKPSKPDAPAPAPASAPASIVHDAKGPSRISPVPVPIEREERVPSLRSGRASGAALKPIRDQLWEDGLPLLRALTGKPDGASRTLLGKLLRDARDDCARMLAALREAADARPIDPVSWLTEAVKERRNSANDIGREWDLPTFGSENKF
jgi:uncharacterized protein YdaU (DUF1376 family)